MADLRTHLKAILDSWSQKYAYPDQRFVAFQELYGAVTHAHILSIFFRDHASKPEWWETHPETEVKAHPKVIPMVNHSLRDGLQTYLMENCASKWKDALIQTARHWKIVPDKAGPWASNGDQIAEQLLADLDLFEWIPLIPLVRNVRNVAFYNGKFCHPQQADISITLHPWTFHFLHGMEINKPAQFLDDWELYGFLIRQMAQCLEALFQHEAVQSISKIESPHLD
jgi:hypothetical protein